MVLMQLLFYFLKIITLTKNQAMLKLYYFMPVFIISLFLSKLKHKTQMKIFGFIQNKIIDLEEKCKWKQYY